LRDTGSIAFPDDAPMVEPTVIPRSDHPISRRDIDPEALKVLYRLRQHNYLAYLVGGSVRDLLLGRRPKDYDIGTSAHPYQVKKLFRNCWIIGRRFRLAHIKFGLKTIEVATFRRQLPPADSDEIARAAEAPGGVPAEPASPAAGDAEAAAAELARHAQRRDSVPGERLIHRDNTFGTPEEDAFRRDFTINALFYDIATLSIIDYVGGLADLQARVVRCIGDPDERFLEDPVRMLRAIVMAARLDFTIDPPTLEAIARHRAALAHSAPARLMEEYYKILRSGAAERTFQRLATAGLLAPVTPELVKGGDHPLWRSLAALDAYRNRFSGAPDTLTNPVLLGTLMVPLGTRRGAPVPDGRGRPQEARLSLGMLPIARRDVERLWQILGLQGRLLDGPASSRARRSIRHRPTFAEALTWLEIQGTGPDVIAQWRDLAPDESASAAAETPPRRRRRRRRRRTTMPGEP
jgi:poly(A) polymerase